MRHFSCPLFLTTALFTASIPRHCLPLPIPFTLPPFRVPPHPFSVACSVRNIPGGPPLPSLSSTHSGSPAMITLPPATPPHAAHRPVALLAFVRRAPCLVIPMVPSCPFCRVATCHLSAAYDRTFLRSRAVEQLLALTALRMPPACRVTFSVPSPYAANDALPVTSNAGITPVFDNT